jgi:intracellular multiplication protein IcmO
LLVGSGVLYVDGKGDNTVFWLVFSFCRRLGREQDLLIINYLTDGQSSADIDGFDDTRISNTTNPFATGSGEQLRSLIVGLMRDSGGDGDMWKGMASALMGGLLKCLTHLRDSGEINLDVTTIRDHLPLDPLVQLALRPDLPEAAIAPVKKYLAELPGYIEEEAILGRIQPKVYEQHGYRIMQFSEILSDLEDTYGHIFSAPLGECDFKDIVFNRRILFVMLPALSKDPDALGGLGKLIVAGVRAALAPALGSELEGSKAEVIDKKPTNSKVPFLIILDEYGYYAVKGFAVVAAQARSLGVSCCFAGQDFSSFKSGSAEEAAATIANTNIKIGMKVEEEETAKILIDRAGEGDITVTEGMEKRDGSASFSRKGSARIERRKRIDLRDLVRQSPGQAHIIWGDKVVRAQLFYADPKEVEEAYLNKFLMINSPSQTRIDSKKGIFSSLENLFSSGVLEEEPDPLDTGLVTFLSDFKFCVNQGEDFQTAATVGLGAIELRDTAKDDALSEKADDAIQDKPKPTAEPESLEQENEDLETSAEPPVTKNQTLESNSAPDVVKANEDAENSSLSKDSTTKETARSGISETSKSSSGSVGERASIHSKEFSRVISEIVLDDVEKNAGSPLSRQHKESIKPENQLRYLESQKGGTPEEIESRVQVGVELLNSVGGYPADPQPQRLDVIEIEDRLKHLVKNITNKTTT